ncbi:hypothetical protein FHG87_018376 [Trinorchestia longiramus]|nr:hypothetical protein FHG87_018376 [Trinorchestia longiramus]
MSPREGGQGTGDAGHTARSLLPTPVNTRPPRLYVAEPLPRCINTTLHQNTKQHSNNHSTNNHNTRPTYNHFKNTTFRIQLRKINPDITTERQKIFAKTFKVLDVPLTKLSENNSGYYAITDEAAAVDKLTSLKATELFKRINLKPIISPDLRAKRTIFIRQLDSSIGKLTSEEITREIKTQQLWAKILEVTKIKNYTHVIKITFSEISITQKKILENGQLMFNTKIPPSQIELEKCTHIQIWYKCYKFEDHATYQCTSTTPSCSECASPQKICLNCNQQHRTLAATYPYRKQPKYTILSKSLKRNFDIDTSFPNRDSQKIFNLFINPTDNPEPAPLATPNTNNGTISTHHDMESESEQSSTETNDTQDQNSDNTEPEQPWETPTKKKLQRKGESLLPSR